MYVHTNIVKKDDKLYVFFSLLNFDLLLVMPLVSLMLLLTSNKGTAKVDYIDRISIGLFFLGLLLFFTWPPLPEKTEGKSYLFMPLSAMSSTFSLHLNLHKNIEMRSIYQ